MLAMPKASEATEWVAAPSISLGFEHNDNLFLSTSSPESVTGSNLTANLDFGARQELWELWGGVRLVSRRYANRDDLDSDNGFVTLRYQYGTERSLWSLQGSYADESLLGTATVDPDVGLVKKETKRWTTNITPAWDWSLTETKHLRVDYQYLDAKYEDGISQGFLDYRQQAVNLTVSDQLTKRASVYAILSYSDFEVTSPESQITTSYTSTSRTNSAQLGISYDFSETIKGSLSGGPRKTASEDVIQTLQFCDFFGFPVPCLVPVTEPHTDYGSVINGSLQSKLELTNMTFRFSRSVSPSGSGSQVQVGDLYLGIQRQITPERLSAQLVAEGYVVRALSNTTSNVDRNYYYLQPGIRWRWTEDLAVEASFRYARQRYLDATDVAVASSVYLTFSYIWPKLSVSR
jgi:hypothetical protein